VLSGRVDRPPGPLTDSGRRGARCALVSIRGGRRHFVAAHDAAEADAARDWLRKTGLEDFQIGKILSDGMHSDFVNPFGVNRFSGANISTIAIEVPITRITSDGKPAATSKNPVIGMFANTLRHAGPAEAGPWVQVSRMANPLVNELIINTPGSAPRRSTSILVDPLRGQGRIVRHSGRTDVGRNRNQRAVAEQHGPVAVADFGASSKCKVNRASSRRCTLSPRRRLASKRSRSCST